MGKIQELIIPVLGWLGGLAYTSANDCHKKVSWTIADGAN